MSYGLYTQDEFFEMLNDAYNSFDGVGDEEEYTYQPYYDDEDEEVVVVKKDGYDADMNLLMDYFAERGGMFAWGNGAFGISEQMLFPWLHDEEVEEVSQLRINIPHMEEDCEEEEDDVCSCISDDPNDNHFIDVTDGGYMPVYVSIHTPQPKGSELEWINSEPTYIDRYYFFNRREEYDDLLRHYYRFVKTMERIKEKMASREE